MRHKVSTLAIILTITSLLITVGSNDSASACECALPATPLEQLDRSAAVFSGKVIAITVNQSIYDKEVKFDIERSWKGEIDKISSVHTGLDSGACGYAFEKGEKYIVYAHGHESRLETDTCSRTKPLANAQEDLNALGTEFKVYKLNVDNQIFNIPYKIVNADVGKIEADLYSNSIYVSMKSHDDGALELTIPRNLVDSKSDNEDHGWLILIDGQEVRDHREIRSSACFRTIWISFSGGAEEIDVMPDLLYMDDIPRLATEVSPVSFATDMVPYIRGQAITVTGCTNLTLDDKEVLLEALDPDGNVHQTITATPNRDGSFSALLTLGSESTPSDNYSVQATYAGYTVVPEFPVNLMIVAALGMIPVLIALRINRF